MLQVAASWTVNVNSILKQTDCYQKSQQAENMYRWCWARRHIHEVCNKKNFKNWDSLWFENKKNIMNNDLKRVSIFRTGKMAQIYVAKCVVANLLHEWPTSKTQCLNYSEYRASNRLCHIIDRLNRSPSHCVCSE